MPNPAHPPQLWPRRLTSSSSIVFVHGLEGDPEATWSRGEVFWPRHLLPHDFPKARIFTFGYSTEPLSSHRGNLWSWVTTSADELCRHLVWQRSQDDLDVRRYILILPFIESSLELTGVLLLGGASDRLRGTQSWGPRLCTGGLLAPEPSTC
jgi:hypothetical protein